MYKNLKVWGESVALIKSIYKIANTLPRDEEYNIKQQLKRSIVSVALNIAEGKCRQSAKDFAHFLNLSTASLNEVNAILNICEELGYFKNLDKIYNEIEVLSKRISSLRTTLLRS